MSVKVRGYRSITDASGGENIMIEIVCDGDGERIRVTLEEARIIRNELSEMFADLAAERR